MLDIPLLDATNVPLIMRTWKYNSTPQVYMNRYRGYKLVNEFRLMRLSELSLSNKVLGESYFAVSMSFNNNISTPKNPGHKNIAKAFSTEVRDPQQPILWMVKISLHLRYNFHRIPFMGNRPQRSIATLFPVSNGCFFDIFPKKELEYLLII